jgi:hypothetical protein
VLGGWAELPTLLASLQAAHGAVAACVAAGLLPLTAVDRAACQRLLQELVAQWVQVGA